jgi:dTDP-4-dehydrorhamnose reductase
MNILLFGPHGQIGWELQRSLSILGEIACIGRDQCDLTSPHSLNEILRNFPADMIVNAAAYTAVDKAEAETAIAHQINADAVDTMARYAASTGALLVHYSTDYIFDGKREQPYLETDTADPLSAYGQSKLAGEQAIVNSACKHLIFRTSWVYSVQGVNFVKTVLRLAKVKASLNVIADQIGAPTSAELIADVTALAIRSLQEGRLPDGIYHLTASGSTSWHGLAHHIVRFALDHGAALALTVDDVHPVPTAGYPLPAQRPSNSMMDTTKLQAALEIQLPDWRHHLDRTLHALTASGQGA